MKRYLYLGLAILPALLLPLAPAVSKDLKLDAFFGTFKGSGVAENKDSLYFGVTVRDLDVTIQRAGQGFDIEWTTVIRRGGNPSKPKVRRKTQKMMFVPAQSAGVYKSTTPSDPLGGKPLAWARIKETSLIINVLSIAKNGSYQVQSYTRKLVPQGMAFTFRRIRDGEPVRTVKGKLIKYAK